jgi:diguanylate cyclase (GGDEF)-like protein
MSHIGLIVFALVVVSAVLALVQLLAWKMLGRRRHALIWACCYGIATVQWAGNLVGSMLAPRNPVIWLVLTALALSTAILSTLGYRARAGAPLGAVPLFCAGGFATVATALTGFFHLTGLMIAIVPLFAAIVLPLGARALLGGNAKPNFAEYCSALALCLFAVFELMVGLAGLSDGIVGTERAIALYNRLLFAGIPALFVATGLPATFLQAADLASEMERRAAIDPLTGALNRRGFAEAAEARIEAARRLDLPLSVLVLDVDRFKAVNDRYGHAAGDAVLARVARFIAGELGELDVLGRLGGEEFGIILANTPARRALRMADRLRAGIGDLAPDAGSPAVTASFGVATMRAGEARIETLINRADRALYAAKAAGRDRVRLAEEDRPLIATAA